MTEDRRSCQHAEMAWRLAMHQVVRWEFLSDTSWPHRQEPFLHERTWAYRGCGLSPETAQAELGPRRVGFDSRDRPVILGPAHIPPEHWGTLDDEQAERDGMPAGVDYEGGPTDLDTVAYADDAVEVSLAHFATSVRTEFDAAGRPVRTVYRGGDEGEERYRWDPAGRLVEIDEDESITHTTMRGSRLDAGGRLSVEHDGSGPLRIVQDEWNELVWERCDEPWPRLLDRAVRHIAATAIEAVKRACARHSVSAGTEVFSMMLANMSDAELDFGIYLGLGADRRAWLASGMSAGELSDNLWNLDRRIENPHIARGEMDIVPGDLGRLMLQEAGLNQPEDAQTFVLNAVAAVLSRHDWRGVMSPTDDFVVYRMGHDEDLRWAHESVRAANPPERLAVWDRNWPSGADRGKSE